LASWDFVCLNTKIILYVAKRYFTTYKMNEQMLSDGLLGFYTAMIRVKNKKNKNDYSQIINYAIKYIRGYIRRGLILKNTQVYPGIIHNKIQKISLISKDNTVCYEDSTNIDIVDYTEKNPLDILIDNDKVSIIKAILIQSCKNNKEKKILNLLLENNSNIQEVSRITGISRQRIYIIKQNIMKKFKCLCAKNKINITDFNDTQDKKILDNNNKYAMVIS